MPQYADLADLPEDDRIAMIAHRAMDHKEIVGFIVDDDAKADRYIKKLKKLHPTITVIDRGPGPVAEALDLWWASLGAKILERTKTTGTEWRGAVAIKASPTATQRRSVLFLITLNPSLGYFRSNQKARSI